MNSIKKILANSKILKNSLFVGLLFSIIVLSSCEDVIKLDLENSKSKIVIESVITDENIDKIFKITKTKDFYTDGNYENVTNAIIHVTDQNGNTFLMNDLGNGLYQSNQIIGIPGNTYYLKIVSEKKEYSAKSVMPQKINIDSLNYEWAENPHYKGYMINLFFKDPSESKNYYRINIFKNGKLYKEPESGNEFILWEDKFFNGNNVKMPAKRGGEFFNLNDTITIELQCLNKETYEYYKTLSNVVAKNNSMMGMGKSMMEGSTAPANPKTNLDNDALGFFAAFCISRKTIIIKE